MEPADQHHHQPERSQRDVVSGTTRSLLSSQKRIIVVTGIQATGKSTISHLLARRFVRGVHVEADLLQHMIVSGGQGAQEPGPLKGEEARQYRLRLKHMCLLGKSFLEAGFTVALDDIITGEEWPAVQTYLQGISFSLIVLAPRVEVVAQIRDKSRAKRPLGKAWALYLDQVLRTTMEGVGYWIDTSEQTPDETVDQILRHIWPEQEI